MERAVICILKTTDQTERVVNELRAAGFTGDDISVLLPDKTSTKDFAHEQNAKVPEGAVTGASAGGLLGGGLGWLVGIGSLAIPGAGPLIGMGIPECEAKQYDGEKENGVDEIERDFDDTTGRRREHGAIGWAVLWLIGIPVPLLLVFFVLRGCT